MRFLRRKLPWEIDQPPRWKGVVYSLIAVAAVIAVIVIIDRLQQYGLHL